MQSPQRLVWSEGMLLSPQHLQGLERFGEAVVAARVGALASSDWGVLALAIDSAALAAGQLRLLQFAGVLPDGLPLAVDGPESAPPPREIAGRFPAAAKRLDIWLGVPREREGVPVYAEEGAVSPSRYLASSRAIADAAAPGASVPVRFARPNAALLLGDELRDDFEAMKIAEVMRAPSGELALVESWVPPCLRLSASPWLLAGLREVLARAIAKQRQLSELRRAREAASDLAAPDLVRLLQLLILNAQIPRLAHLADAGDAPPRECYLALAQLYGQLCTFKGDDPAALPKLSHTDLRSSFEPLFARLSEMLGGLVVQQYVAVPLEQRPGGLFLARLQEERTLRGQLFLAVKSEQPEATVIERLPHVCKVASSFEISELIKIAARGLPLKVVHRPPPQLPVRPDAIYFALVPDDRYWQGIVAGRNVAFYLAPPFDPAKTKLELLAIPGEAGAPAP